MAKINVENAEITVIRQNEDAFISLTVMARSQLQEHIIFRWLSLKSTIEYLGEWEMLYNPDFNCTEFGAIKNAAGSNNFVLSVKTWIERTNAIGIVSKAGRYGGTYAHRDIAYHFGMWISPRFQLLLVKEYQRLKAEEQKQLGWSAKQWREANPDLKGNIRDYATINQLICLSNMENLNAVFINDGLPQSERLEKPNKIAIQQMQVLENVDDRRLLK